MFSSPQKHSLLLGFIGAMLTASSAVAGDGGIDIGNGRTAQRAAIHDRLASDSMTYVSNVSPSGVSWCTAHPDCCVKASGTTIAIKTGTVDAQTVQDFRGR
jgi:hypothetical protein